MYTNTCLIEGRPRTDETVSAALGPIHDEWIKEARQFLLPATSADASFWDRWSAVRYLNDQYTERHRAESELVSELRPFVPARDHDMLIAGGERVAELRLTLDHVGRRRVTASEFTRAVTDFLKALELWCAEIELAGSSVRATALPEEARRMLDNVVRSPRMRYLTLA